jgi:hypothetical protein
LRIETRFSAVKIRMQHMIKGGVDTDGNGKREIFIMGTLFADSTAYLCTAIYENAGNDILNRVGTLIHDGGVGAAKTILCNIDVTGGIEYVTATSGLGLDVYRSTVPGSWEQVGTAYGFGGGIFTYDLNKNGVPEVIWQRTSLRVCTWFARRISAVGFWRAVVGQSCADTTARRSV